MPYTVKQLAELSGVSVRTLHWYDEISLLKPAYHGTNGYRFYEDEELFRLQQIMFYRELGFKLDDIQRVLEGSDFDKISALHTHRRALANTLDHTEGLIETIDKTIVHLKGESKMNKKVLTRKSSKSTKPTSRAIGAARVMRLSQKAESAPRIGSQANSRT